MSGLSESRRQRIAANRAAIKRVRDSLVCARCGSTPVEFHSDDHLTQPSRRIHALAGTCRTETVLAEMARCTPLCRRCHVITDGRLERLHARNRARFALRRQQAA